MRNTYCNISIQESHSMNLISSYLQKVCIIGSKKVGKTSLFNRLTKERDRRHSSVLQTYHSALEMTVLDTSFNINLWDWSSQLSRGRQYYTGSTGLILLFDVMDRESLTSLEQLVHTALTEINTPEVACILVGNQIDMRRPGNHGITKQVVDTWIESMRSPRIRSLGYVECSALENRNMDSILSILIPELLHFEKRCYNCFKTFDTIKYKDGFYYCESCFFYADRNKSMAFQRIQPNSSQ